jgi:hypothetical protein
MVINISKPTLYTFFKLNHLLPTLTDGMERSCETNSIFVKEITNGPEIG